MSRIEFSISHTDTDKKTVVNQEHTHIHKECEIYLNLSGDVSFEVENRIYPISCGSVIITRPYEYHHCIYHSKANHEHYWITFSAEQNQDFLDMFFNRKKGTDNLVILTDSNLTRICALFDNLLNKDTDALKQRISFLEIFDILNTGKRAECICSTDGLPDDVAKALKYMEEHLTEDIGINKLSSVCNVSINTLERHFRASLDTTPIAMLRKRRLIASTAHLREGATVYEAAIRSGFSDYSNYIFLFRKEFGITPLTYKKSFEFRE